MKFIYETKQIKNSKKSKLIKKAKKFFQENMPKEDETFIVLKARRDEKNDVDVYGAYFGSESSPVSIYAQSGWSRSRAFLAEALDSQAIIEFIEKETNVNLYLFKVKYENFVMQEIKSFYAQKYDNINVMVYDVHEEEEDKGSILQQFGEDKATLTLDPMSLEDE